MQIKHSFFRWCFPSIILAVAGHFAPKAVAGDGNTDIIWRNTATDVNGVWSLSQPRWYDTQITNNTVGYFPTFGSVCGSACWKIAAVADFNRDGQPDLLWRDQGSGQKYPCN